MPINAALRYHKFSWLDISSLSPIGKTSYLGRPKLSRMFAEGTFHGEHLEAFPPTKAKRELAPLGRCAYCSCEKDSHGLSLKLTSEHIIPEFLGAGLELPSASCASCQKVTSTFEGSLAQELFDPIRKAFLLVGKNSVLEKANFPVDIGVETTRYEFIHHTYHPTILVMPMLYPAASYSRRPKEIDALYALCAHNVNADPSRLQQYDLDSFSSQHLDLVRLAQMIAKIAHVYAVHHFRSNTFTFSVADFIRTDYPPGASSQGYLEHIGCLLSSPDKPSINLHEIEVGKIVWSEKNYAACRVRLFARFDMPSYYVTVGILN